MSDASSSSLAEMESLSLFRANAEGLVGEVRWLETVYVQTGEDMTKERLLLLDSPSLHHKDFAGMLLLRFAHLFIKIVVQFAHLPVEDILQVESVFGRWSHNSQYDYYKEPAGLQTRPRLC